MKKLFIVVVALLVLTACTPSATELGKDTVVLPEALKECTMYRLMNSNGGYIYVLDCPHKSCSATATTGKTPKYVNHCS